jgi:hypothetical protein
MATSVVLPEIVDPALVAAPVMFDGPPQQPVDPSISPYWRAL